jgi:RNA polymerase sigma factor (sigma-70 family)
MDTAPLTQNLDAFVNFVRSRTGDAELAADIVQDCLLKAMRSDVEPRDGEASVQWFYRVLRHAVIDAHRRRTARAKALTAYATEWPESLEPEDERRLCQCIDTILPALSGTDADLIRRVDLGGESPAAIAATTGERVNTLHVRLYRARRELRRQLEQLCRTCAKHGCLDCECDQPC